MSVQYGARKSAWGPGGTSSSAGFRASATTTGSAGRPRLNHRSGVQLEVDASAKALLTKAVKRSSNNPAETATGLSQQIQAIAAERFVTATQGRGQRPALLREMPAG